MTDLREPASPAAPAIVDASAQPTATLPTPDARVVGGADPDELAIAVARGDAGAFAALYDVLAPRIHGMLLALLGSADAERVTGEVLVEAWRAAPRLLREGRSIERWATCRALVAGDAGAALGTAA